jgi:hypothetical protein
MVVGVPLLLAVPGGAGAVSSSGTAQVVKPQGDPNAGQPLTSGGSHTSFSLKLPSGAACTGDGVAGYRVQSYMVPSSVDPSTLTFDANGPHPQATGANFRQPLFKTDTTPYVNDAPNTGDAAIINIPNLTHSVWTINELPAGTYNLGIACTQPTPNQSQIDKFWVGTVTIVASGTDPNGFTWTTSGGTTTTTTAGGTTTTTTAGGTTTTTLASTTTSTTPGATSTLTVPASTTTSAAPGSSSTTSTTATGVTSTSAPAGTASGATLSTSSGPGGTTLTVNAGGFMPGSSAQIIFHSTPVVLASVKADGNGLVSASVTVPASAAPGDHTIEVSGVGADGSPRSVSASFTVSGTLAPPGTLAVTGARLLALVPWAAFFMMVGAIGLAAGRTRRLNEGPRR